MKNRDKLLNTAIYDVLCTMNKKMREDDMQTRYGYPVCIMDLLDNVECVCSCNMDRVTRSCTDCINNYLNKEV